MKIGSKIKDIVIDSKNMDYNITDLPLTVQGLSLVKGIDQHIYRMYIKLDQKLINAHPNLAIWILKTFNSEYAFPQLGLHL